MADVNTEAIRRQRRAKAANVKRSGNMLETMIASDRGYDEIMEKLQKMTLAYEETVQLHDTLSMTLTDAEFDVEETWLEQYREHYIHMEMKAKDYIKTLSRANINVDVSEPVAHNSELHDTDTTNLTVQERGTANDNTPDNEVMERCKFQMERPKIPKFGGDVREYATFKSDFLHIVGSKYPKRDCITLLRSSLYGKALDIITGVGNDYDAAWHYLDAIFGDPRYVADTITQDLTKFKPIKEGDDSRFCELVHLVRRSYNALKEVGRKSDMDNNHILALIEQKMNTDDRKVWSRECEKSDAVTLDTLLAWMDSEMKARLRATAPLRTNSSNYTKHVGTVDIKHDVSNDVTRQFAQFDKCWLCKTSDHFTDQCAVFINKPAATRLQLVKNNKACFSCLKKATGNHNVHTCRRRKPCGEYYNGNPCKYYHHKLLHPDDPDGGNTQSAAAQSVGNFTNIEQNNSLLPIIQCDLLGKMGSGQNINLLFDSGSQISLIKTETANRLNLQGKPITITVSKVGGDIEEMCTKLYEAKLRSLDNNSVHKVALVGIPYITESKEVINLDKLVGTFGLAGRKLLRGNGEVDVLIGVDHVTMHGGINKQVGHLSARLSPLGWVICGGKAGNYVNCNRVNHMQMLKPVDITDFWTIESMGVTGKMCNCKAVKMTKCEQEEAKLIEDSCEKVGSQWKVSYPWQRDPGELPNNRTQAVKRLQSLENRLDKAGSDMKTAYNDQISQLVANKFARKLSAEEIERYNGPVHYISHHPIVKPDSQSTPLRIVFNSSASFQGHVLNEYWFKGPDLLNDLFGVIMKFRENSVALCGDISKMYHRVLIPEVDQHVHRFLWRGMDREREPDTYIMSVVTFGDKPAPAMAQTALRKTAEENVEYTHVKEVLLQNVYMDDICVSVSTKEDASRLIKDIDYVLGTGGFKVKRWYSNVELMAHQNTDNNPDAVDLGSQEKVLGVAWNSQNDKFFYKVNTEVCGGFNDPSVELTKRTILSRIAQIFDPIGFAAAFLIKAKIGMQKLWQLGLEWDEVLPKDIQQEWVALFKEMENLNNVTFERCLRPSCSVGDPTLCIFCDASEDAFGACAYVRWLMEDGSFDVRFIAAKSRVAPLKRITIPRLELQSAVLAARLYRTIKEECRFQFSSVYFFSDSQIALAWIKSEGRGYKSFVSNRVCEIQSISDPSQWFHVPGEQNAADDVSRGISVSMLGGRWREGPDFLRKPVEEFTKIKINPDVEQVAKEKKKVRVVNSVVVKEAVVDCTQFSTWRRLVRVTGWVLLFVKKLRNRIGRCIGKIENSGLDKYVLEEAEKYWILDSQRSLVDKYKDGTFKNLSPFLDGNEVIRVGGRVDRANVSYDTRHPILIPYDHWIATLITRYYHNRGHAGVASTVAQIRSKFWIIKAHDLAKHVKYRCVGCRKLEQKAESQFMAELPEERLAPHTPPFYNTSVDYFGPFTVKIGRSKRDKHYGVIFTCLNTRSVHLEMATDYGTNEFLQVLRRFMAIRGTPAVLISDNGTQLVGAERELREMIKKWDKESLGDYCTERKMQWKFVTPQAPHHNGCAESLVKGCKRAIKIAIGDHVLSPFELYTCFLEVANLLNQRPIGRVPNDPDDGHYLCPNDILLGRASSEVPDCPVTETGNIRNRAQFVQGIVQSFWRRWTRDVFPTLVPRKKWQVDKRNVRIGDVVIVMEQNAVRGKWTVGRIIEVFTGGDGRVRSVKVKTGKGEYTRPITKLAVIDPVQE